MGECDGDRATIESICPSCVARQRALERPSMDGLVVTWVEVVDRQVPPRITAILRREGELRGIGVGATETDALLDAIRKHEERTEREQQEGIG